MQIEEELKKDILSRNGPENIHQLHDEMADWMVRNVTVKRDNRDLQADTGQDSKKFENDIRRFLWMIGANLPIKPMRLPINLDRCLNWRW